MKKVQFYGIIHIFSKVVDTFLKKLPENKGML